MSVDTINLATYMRPSVAAEYVAATGLFAAEKAILERYQNDIAGKRVLDIGVGGGRTTAALTALAAAYIGVDYSEAMIHSARRRYPDVAFHQADARHMPDFAAGSFDFAMFSFNGLDYVDQPGRVQILGEVLRLLKPAGVFVFSSHNLDHLAGRSSFIRRRLRSVRDLRPLTRPGQAIRWAGNSAVCMLNHMRHVRMERRTADYAILNDPAHNFALLHYYIGGAAQLRQLRQAGFNGTVEIFGMAGEPVAPGDRSVFLHYAARKS